MLLGRRSGGRSPWLQGFDAARWAESPVFTASYTGVASLPRSLARAFAALRGALRCLTVGAFVRFWQPAEYVACAGLPCSLSVAVYLGEQLGREAHRDGAGPVVAVFCHP